MNITGIIIAAAAFLLIGVFHPIVIKAEYRFSKKCWPVFLAVGAAAVLVSLFMDNFILSALFGFFGCCCLWSILELHHQEARVKKGWFPKNPSRRDKDS